MFAIGIQEYIHTQSPSSHSLKFFARAVFFPSLYYLSFIFSGDFLAVVLGLWTLFVRGDKALSIPVWAIFSRRVKKSPVAQTNRA